MFYIETDSWQTLCADVQERAAQEFTFNNPVFVDEKARQLFERAFVHASELSSRDTMESETALVNLAACLQDYSTQRGFERSPAYGSVRRAKDRIDSDPAAPISLSDLAAETGLSRYQVIRAFSKQLGMTPHAYVMQKRIQLARHLLRRRISLAEVAVVAGFYDQPHFTRSFTRQLGITPSRYAATIRS
jgi:AraC-like DNA-binding protein